MPFELPEYENAFVEFLHEVVNDVARAGDPILSQIRVEKQGTTAASRIRSQDGVDLDLPERKVGFSLTTSLDDVRSANFGEFAAHVDEAAETLRGELAKGFFDTMSSVTKATGNVVDAGGTLTYETIYE